MSNSIKKWEELNEQKFDPELNQIFPGYYTNTTQPILKDITQGINKSKKAEVFLYEIRKIIQDKFKNISHIHINPILIDNNKNPYIILSNSQTKEKFKLISVEEYNG